MTDTRARVLFVDDEPMVLSALRRMLMPQRQRWAMHFAESVPSALQLMAQEPFDVVVSDMRMPGMNGSALLHEVHRLYPRVYRMILSGYAEAEATASVMEVAQRYLTKPCASGDLIAAIEEGCGRPT